MDERTMLTLFIVGYPLYVWFWAKLTQWALNKVMDDYTQDPDIDITKPPTGV